MWSKTEKMWSKLTITVYEDNYSLWGLVQRVRVLGSLWKPHQSKELFFPFRYRYPELFPTPPKFGDSSVWSRERGSELRNCGFHFTKHTMFYKGKPVLNQVPYENPVPNHVLDFKQTYLWAQEELVEVLGTYIERKKQFFRLARFPEWSAADPGRTESAERYCRSGWQIRRYPTVGVWPTALRYGGPRPRRQ